MRLLENHGKILPDEFSTAIGLGLLPGWEAFRRFGMNDAVNGAGTREQMWPPGTVKTLPAAAAVAAVSSDSVDDDADPAGTGAWTVQLNGLDENFLEVSETVTLNGTTPVNSTQTFIRLNHAAVLTAGSGGINAGNISISVGGNLQSYIEIDEGQSHQTDYCVPADKTLVIAFYYARVGRMAGTSDAQVTGEIRLGAGEADESWRAISDIYLYNGGVHQNGDTRTVIPAKTDLRQRISSTAATQAVGIFAGYLIKNEVLGTYL